MSTVPEEDRYLVTKSQILDRVTSALAGRAAEELMFDDVYSGAANDLELATHLVRRMIMEFGMSDKLGPLTFGRKEGQVFLGRDLGRERDYSEEVAAAIDQEGRAIINECFEKAKALLEERKDTLILVAETLLERETLKGAELIFLAGNPLPPVKSSDTPVVDRVEDKPKITPIKESGSGAGERLGLDHGERAAGRARARRFYLHALVRTQYLEGFALGSHCG